MPAPHRAPRARRRMVRGTDACRGIWTRCHPLGRQNATGDDRLADRDADTRAKGVLGRADARRAVLAWSHLPDSIHPHPSELAPTTAELRRWHSEVISWAC